jgi:hypothetical protein
MNMDFHNRNKRSSGREPALTGLPLASHAWPRHSSLPEGENVLQPGFNSQHSTFNSKRRVNERGVALVITLILLSVTLVMAVAFLAISRRERGSVTTESDTTTAKFAADSALAQAEARIVSQILITTNPYVQSLLVSTNYYNISGFDPGFDNGTPNPTNVNYNYRILNGGPVVPGSVDFEQNIANLYFNPRPPVYYNTNDFRYYLDLNRNGRYDTNGFVEDFDDHNPPNDLGTVSLEVGDPEWIGVLEHPDQPHGPNNQFIARYCFIAVPADTLDINDIHNQAFNVNVSSGNVNVFNNVSGNDSYLRNQGVGSWEINLAAFLADLNTNRWDPGLANFFGLPNEPYSYSFSYPPGPVYNKSFAFDDARALVAWRYGNNYNWLNPAARIFPGLANYPFNVDMYSVGPQQTLFNANYTGSANPSTQPWLGSPATNDFFYSPSELFDPTKSSQQFVNNLTTPGTDNSTYDRYTFYRMLAQISSDSAPESGKININFSNAVVSYITNIDGVLIPTAFNVVPNAETNMALWQPGNFFNAAADKMLHAYSAEWYESSPSNYIHTYYGISQTLPTPPYTYFTNIDGMQVTNIAYGGQTNQIPAFGVTNIPVYVNGTFVYTPAINRILQLAANIYDSVTWTNDPLTGISNYPSVFRPIFWTTNEVNSLGFRQTNVYIKGYVYVVEPLVTNGNPIFNAPVEVNTLPFGITTSNVWGVPWIIGAKKGFPNFNAFEWQSSFFIERELQFTRDKSDPEPANSTFPFGRTYHTNQMYIVGVSNLFGSENWNSYQASYNNPVTIVAQDYLSMQFSNGAAGTTINNNYIIPIVTNKTVWPGNSTPYSPINPSPASFVTPFGPDMCVNEPLNPQYPSTNNTYLFYYGTGSGSVMASGVPFTGPTFIPVSMNPPNYPDAGTLPLPQFSLLATNRLQAYVLENDANGTRILDYVQLGGMDASLDINHVVADNSYGNTEAYSQGLWSTNYYAGTIPYGVYEQFVVSSIGGGVPAVDEDGGGSGGLWSRSPVPGVPAQYATSSQAQQAFFSAFFSPQSEAPFQPTRSDITNTLLAMQAPFTPMRLVVQRFVYQANDPLVHYLASDMYDFPDSTNFLAPISQTNTPPLLNPPLGTLNDRYMPWGRLGNLKPFGPFTGSFSPDNNPYNLSYKDPLVLFSDSWDFPTNRFPSIGWLGRVHRGTPWQTVYLKSTNVLALQDVIGGGQVTGSGLGTWMPWTGNVYNFFDAQNTAPVQDRLLFDLFTATPNDDATRGELSVNVGADQPFNPMVGLAAWSAVLSGSIAFSNNVNDNILTSGFKPQAQDPISGYNPPGYSNLLVQPYGVNNSAMFQLVQSINRTRTNFVGIDGLHGVFEHAGDVLSASALSDGSPFLQVLKNGAFDNAQVQHGISDEMYEWLPQQIMGLLTVNGTPQAPPRYVVYCYGQTLKPAPNGIVTSGTYFGLVTNYQVTAESASRAIIRLDNTPTPINPNAKPHVVVEQYNPLPPD